MSGLREALRVCNLLWTTPLTPGVYDLKICGHRTVQVDGILLSSMYSINFVAYLPMISFVYCSLYRPSRVLF
jgi:hypothetical protein